MMIDARVKLEHMHCMRDEREVTNALKTQRREFALPASTSSPCLPARACRSDVCCRDDQEHMPPRRPDRDSLGRVEFDPAGVGRLTRCRSGPYRSPRLP